MNNKGFAITTILYGTLILFLMLFVSVLGILATYKDRLALLIDGNNGARDIINGNSCNDTPSNSCIVSSDGITPELDPGMIPVVISNDGTVKTVSVCGDGWHNYVNKQWANVVLVDNDSRTTYKDSTGVTVNQDDILAYFVWIPRYKYKIWTVDATKTTSPQTIDIVFESRFETRSLGETVGTYRTHPAFWWDNDSDGVEDSGELISGFWIGKFETTGGDGKRTVLPNITPAKMQTVAKKIKGAKSFTDDGNVYGLDNTISDSHISLNSDWGAAAYLAHSKYGINGEVRTNNRQYFRTGCGAETSTSGFTETCQIKYGSGVADYPQSTTGNISGVFDMAGGIMEVVMGNYNGKDGSGTVSSMPVLKYLNKYTFNDVTICTISTCGGHALFETKGWYDDEKTFVGSGAQHWMVRGGSYFDTSSSNKMSRLGIFYYARVGGGEDNSGWRTSIVVGFGR